MEKFSIRLFGAFRTLGQDSMIEVEATVPICVSVLKEILYHEIQRRASSGGRPDLITLVSDSALATEECVLFAQDNLEQGCTLALLPPVCGG